MTAFTKLMINDIFVYLCLQGEAIFKVQVCVQLLTNKTSQLQHHKWILNVTESFIRYNIVPNIMILHKALIYTVTHCNSNYVANYYSLRYTLQLHNDNDFVKNVFGSLFFKPGARWRLVS